MQCDEKKQICLNYATNVPEWQLGLMLEALAALGEASGACGKVQKAVAGDMAWAKMHPGSEYLGTIPINRVDACKSAAVALGKAMYALEVLLSQSDQFGFAFGLTLDAESAYKTKHSALEEMIQKHQYSEVGCIYGQNEHL